MRTRGSSGTAHKIWITVSFIILVFWQQANILGNQLAARKEKKTLLLMPHATVSTYFYEWDITQSENTANITIFDRKFSTGHFSIFKGKFSTPIFSTENFRHILKLTKENFRQIFDRWVVESFRRNSSICIKSAKDFFRQCLLGSRKIFDRKFSTV